ncbi:MAG: hypothetical protein WCI21_03930 [Alphaproteobacteria bacterium]
MFAALPLLALPVLFYNIMALTLRGGFAAPYARDQLASPLFSIPITSGAIWQVNLGDLILAGALMVLLDVLAGFVVTIMSARKDVDFHEG